MPAREAAQQGCTQYAANNVIHQPLQRQGLCSPVDVDVLIGSSLSLTDPGSRDPLFDPFSSDLAAYDVETIPRVDRGDRDNQRPERVALPPALLSQASPDRGEREVISGQPMPSNCLVIAPGFDRGFIVGLAERFRRHG